LLPIPMEVAPPMSALYLSVLFWTAIVLYYYYCFVYCGIFLIFIHLAFRTHVSSCVRGGI
jgi:hypothetical protein